MLTIRQLSPRDKRAREIAGKILIEEGCVNLPRGIARTVDPYFGARLATLRVQVHGGASVTSRTFPKKLGRRNCPKLKPLHRVRRAALAGRDLSG